MWFTLSTIRAPKRLTNRFSTQRWRCSAYVSVHAWAWSTEWRKVRWHFDVENLKLKFAHCISLLNIWWRNRISIFSFADESVSHESKNFNDSPERSRCQICLPRESTPRYALCSEFVMNGSASRSNSPTFHHFIYHSRHKYLDCVQWGVFGVRNG